VSTRHLRVRPDLTQLKHQAKDFLRAIDAIWRDDVDILRALVVKRPALLHEMARGVKSCNWGPPMSYAANLGRDRIIKMLWELGAKDVKHAAGRAALQGQIDTGRMLYEMAGRPPVPKDAVMGPCEALNPEGLAFVLELGAEICDHTGDRRAPIALLLETYSRNPRGKHRCLEIMVEHGIDLPDTPPMAVHRGSLDLLERHLRRDPDLLRRTFSHADIYPRELGCHEDAWLAVHGTPLDGATLLHMCIDYGELEIATWLLDRGMDANVRAAIDADGFGGHTPLFSAVVSYACYVSAKYASPKPDRDAFAELLLDRGADVNVRASLRSRLYGNEPHDYRDVTPLGWGERFHDQDLVSRPAMRLIEQHGGHV
jgi:ankyrin repeat protein